jgi:hypothetical protein
MRGGLFSERRLHGACCRAGLPPLSAQQTDAAAQAVLAFRESGQRHLRAAQDERLKAVDVLRAQTRAQLPASAAKMDRKALTGVEVFLRHGAQSTRLRCVGVSLMLVLACLCAQLGGLLPLFDVTVTASLLYTGYLWTRLLGASRRSCSVPMACRWTSKGSLTNSASPRASVSLYSISSRSSPCAATKCGTANSSWQVSNVCFLAALQL